MKTVSSILGENWRFTENLKEVKKSKRLYRIYQKFYNEIRFLEYALSISQKLHNPFIESIYHQLSIGKKLTDKQLAAVHRIQQGWNKQRLWDPQVLDEEVAKQQELDQAMKLLSKAEMNSYDATFFNSMLQQYESYGKLSDKQLVYIYRFLKKYHKQIMVNLFD